jgi:hypothetical protein
MEQARRTARGSNGRGRFVNAQSARQDVGQTDPGGAAM